MSEPDVTEQGRDPHRRAEELLALLRDADPMVSYWEHSGLVRELIEVLRRFGEIEMRPEELDGLVRQLDDSEKSVAESERVLEALNREPTSEERVMLDFMERLSTRQGTVMPDFDALFGRKAELDHRMLDEPKKGIF